MDPSTVDYSVENRWRFRKRQTEGMLDRPDLVLAYEAPTANEAPETVENDNSNELDDEKTHERLDLGRNDRPARVAEDGPLPLLLIHGMRLSGAQFHPILATPEMKTLAQRHGIQTPDVPGHGKNEALRFSVEASSRVFCGPVLADTEDGTEFDWDAEKRRMASLLDPYRPGGRGRDGGGAKVVEKVKSVVEGLAEMASTLPRTASETLKRLGVDGRGSPERPERSEGLLDQPPSSSNSNGPLPSLSSSPERMPNRTASPANNPAPLRPHIIGGTSLGSYLSLSHALLHPQSISALILMNSCLNPTFPLAFPYLAFTQLMTTWSDSGPIRRLYDKGLERYVERGRTRDEVSGVLAGGSYFRGGGEAVARGVLGWDYLALASAFVAATSKYWNETRRLRILLMNGSDDFLFLLHEPQFIKVFSAPHILLSVVRIPESGHLSFLDNPRFVGSAIANFVARVQEEHEFGETIERPEDGEEVRDVGGVEGWKRRLVGVGTSGDGKEEIRQSLELGEREAQMEAEEEVKKEGIMGRLSVLRGWLGLGEKDEQGRGRGKIPLFR